jgi:hypothetical protein
MYRFTGQGFLKKLDLDLSRLLSIGSSGFSAEVIRVMVPDALVSRTIVKALLTAPYQGTPYCYSLG